ncbi:MAG: GNAT family N-acetyltransferase [Steroidobacteraceae bacterium]|jgi:RimJ/RimL family protein N-acetyltransferase|nr:GNAT family N-acetyltransferase [Steroidobacteraceae bacterium]
MQAPQRIAGDRVTLEAYGAAHIVELVAAVRESVPELSAWLPWCHAGYGIRDATDWVRACAAGWANESGYQFAVLDTGGRFVGGLGLRVSDPQNGVASLGYWIRTSATRRGLATAAVRTAAHHAFGTLGLARLEIFAREGNSASRRVAERAGASFECVARNRIAQHGVSYPAALYSLVPEDLAG